MLRPEFDTRETEHFAEFIRGRIWVPVRTCRRNEYPVQPVAAANAGSSSCGRSDDTGPAWLRWSLGVFAP